MEIGDGEQYMDLEVNDSYKPVSYLGDLIKYSKESEALH
jgi:hypothetical protein